MELSIVIVNYKTKGLLKQCLRGISECSLPFEYEIIVVDNDSQDGSVELVQQHFPHVRLVVSPSNVGFGAGMNKGFAIATGRYVMTLNSDVAVFPEALVALHRFMDEHPRAGIAVPKLINPDGTTQLSVYRFPNFFMALWRRTPFGNLPGPRKAINRFLMKEWNHADQRPVGWALGAALFMRRSALDEVGGFDEHFFLFVEDTDVCRRFWLKEWSVEYVPTAEMVHYHQRPSASVGAFGVLFSYPARLHVKSWVKYFRKYRGQPNPPHSL